MSGGSSSSSSSASTNNTSNTDKRLVVDGSSLGVSADNSSVSASISITDGGAVKNSLDFAAGGYKDLLALTNDVLGGVFDIVKSNNEAVAHISATSTEAVAKANDAANQTNNDNRYLVAAGIAVVGIVAMKVWGK